MQGGERQNFDWPVMAAGLGLGVALMYALDPIAGRRRRALVRDKSVHAAHKLRDGAGTTARDVGNRLAGCTARLRGFVARGTPDDDVLAARVRSALGRAARHPRSLEVHVRDGVVTLSGPVPAEDVARIVRATTRVRGVKDVESRLEVHERPGTTPGLQGAGVRPDVWQAHWSPTTRLVAGAAGALLCARGPIRGGPLGLVCGVVGAGLALRALTNLELERVFGIGAGRRVVDVQKTISLNASIDRVFAPGAARGDP